MDEAVTKKLKISVLGANKSGKTALTVRFLTGKFIFEYASGHDITYQHNFSVTSSPHHVPLQIVDTSCNENPTNALNECDGLLIVYAIDSMKSFKKAKQILTELIRDEGREPCVALVANKYDLWPHKSVERDDGRKLAERFHCKYYEMSALSNKEGVFNMFSSVIHLAVERNKVRSLSLPIFTKPVTIHEDIKRSNSLQFPMKKENMKSNGPAKTKTITKSLSMSANLTYYDGKQAQSNSKSRRRTSSESSHGKCDIGPSRMNGSNGNMNRLLHKTLIGDLGNAPSEQKKTDKTSLIHKTLGDMGHIAFSAIAFPMSMSPRELAT